MENPRRLYRDMLEQSAWNNARLLNTYLSDSDMTGLLHLWDYNYKHDLTMKSAAVVSKCIGPIDTLGHCRSCGRDS